MTIDTFSEKSITPAISENVVDFNAFRESRFLEAYKPNEKKTCEICKREMDYREPQVNIQGRWICLECTAIALKKFRHEQISATSRNQAQGNQKSNIIAFPGIFKSNTTTGGTTA